MSIDVQSAVSIATAEPVNQQIKPESIDIWNEAEFCILHTLSVRIPFMSELQAIHSLKVAGHAHAAGVSCLNRLRENGWLSRFRCVANWPSMSEQAIVSWSPGHPKPDLGHERTIARQSPHSSGLRNIRFYVASRWTANLFGSSYRGTVSTELVTPWLKWAQVYLRLLGESPELAPDCNCRTIPCPGEKIGNLPPYLSINRDGVPSRVIAILRESSAARLDALHDYCEQHSIPYQLW